MHYFNFKDINCVEFFYKNDMERYERYHCWLYILKPRLKTEKWNFMLSFFFKDGEMKHEFFNFDSEEDDYVTNLKYHFDTSTRKKIMILIGRTIGV